MAAEPGRSSSQRMVLTFRHSAARDTPAYQAAVRFVELTRQKTGGRIQVQVVSDSPTTEVVRSLVTAPPAAHFLAWEADRLAALAPEWEAVSLPFIFPSQASADKVLDPSNPVAKELFGKLRPKGLQGMAIWMSGFKHVTNAKRPLGRPADFKGVILGVMQESEWAFLSALGGSPWVIAPQELPTKLRQGLVDGQYGIWTSLVAQKLDRVQQYGTIGRGGALASRGVAVNASWWDSLDKHTQQLLGEAIREASGYQNQLAKDEEAIALEQLKASGRLQLHEQTREEARAWAAAAALVHERWQSRVGGAMVNKVKGLSGDWPGFGGAWASPDFGSLAGS